MRQFLSIVLSIFASLILVFPNFANAVFYIELKEPVLIIPGVLGTELVNNVATVWLNPVKLIDPTDSFLDQLIFTSDLKPVSGDVLPSRVISEISPIFDYTQGLLDEFTSRGYEEGRDLFLFPYDWRYGVGEPNLSLLKNRIQELYNQTGLPVNVIAHSTGGLLLKKYVMDNPNDNFIDKVIFVGVPHLGAPKAVKTLLAGDGFGVPGLSHLEMKKLAANFPVVYDLLPTKKYYATKGSYLAHILLNGFGDLRDLTYEETRQFLLEDHALNTLAYQGTEALHTIQFDNFDLRQRGIDVYNVVGCNSGGTIGKLTQIRAGGVAQFVAGYDIKYTAGDQTVPIESATNVPVDQDKRYFALKVGHGDLLSNSETRREMVNIFEGQANTVQYERLTHDVGQCNLKGKAIAIFSPLRIAVTDQFGRSALQTSVDTVENAIPGVMLDVIGDHKFLWLPDGENEYSITVQGTGNGTFTLRESDYADGNIMASQQFTNVPVTDALRGSLMVSSSASSALLELDTNNDGIIDKNVIPDIITPGEIPIAHVDVQPPVSAVRLTGSMGQDNYFRSDVTVTLSADDNNAKIYYRFDAAADYALYDQPINVTADKLYNISYYAEDVTGNKEFPQRAEWTIDTQAPEVALTFDESVQDLVFTPLDADPGATITQGIKHISISDKAGNVTRLEFEEKDRKKVAQATLTRIYYNDALYDLTANRFVARWQIFPKRGLVSLTEKVALAGDGSIILQYNGKKTEILTRLKKRVSIETVPGLAKLLLKTNKGNLERVLVK